jgi:tetratricopeptide (TPR) repeat protein
LGELYRLKGDLEQARILYDRALPQFEKLRDQNGLGYYQRGLGDIALVQGRWDKARQHFQHALDIMAQEHRPVKTWTYAYGSAGLGRALVGIGNFSEGRQALQEAICWARERRSWDLVLVPMVGFAALCAATGELEKAVELAAFVIEHPLSWNETKSRAALELARASQGLSESMLQAAKAHARSMSLDEAVQFALASPGENP